MVSQLTVIDAAFLSRSRGGGDKKDAREREGKERKNKTSGETDARLNSLILSVLKRHNSRLQRSTVKSMLNPCAVN